MTRYLKLWIPAFSLATVAFAGCTNEEDLGGRSAASDGGTPSGDGSNPINDPDASTSSPDSGNKDSGAANLFGETAAGESCSPADYPPAPATCAIEGQYIVTENDCLGGACASGPTGVDGYQWVANVTVTGTEVKLTNGTDRLFHCQLKTSCDCRDSNGELLRFSNSGFVGLGRSDCPGSFGYKLYYMQVGVKL